MRRTNCIPTRAVRHPRGTIYVLLILLQGDNHRVVTPNTSDACYDRGAPLFVFLQGSSIWELKTLSRKKNIWRKTQLLPRATMKAVHHLFFFWCSHFRSLRHALLNPQKTDSGKKNTHTHNFYVPHEKSHALEVHHNEKNQANHQTKKIANFLTILG